MLETASSIHSFITPHSEPALSLIFGFFKLIILFEVFLETLIRLMKEHKILDVWAAAPFNTFIMRIVALLSLLVVSAGLLEFAEKFGSAGSHW